MKKTIYIYDNDRQSTGVSASENLVKSYNGGDCEEITVEIPDSMEPYETETGETMVKRGEFYYSLNQILKVDKNDYPYLVAVEPGQTARRLKVVSRNGRKSLAFTI